MISDVFSELMQYREVGGDMVERIKRISVFHLFEPLHTAFGPDPALFNKLLFYVLEVYSIQSPALILAADWQELKEAMFDKYALPDDLLAAVVLVTHPGFQQTVRAYVDYQQSTSFRHFCMLQDLYTQYLNLALSLPDVDEKNKAQRYATVLLGEIDQFKTRLRQDYHLFASAEKELPKSEKKQAIAISLSVENYAHNGIEEE
jgi:hypothetical protein